MTGATAIIGAGLVAKATAAFLAHHGRDVALWSPSGRSASELRQRADVHGTTTLRYRGALAGEARVRMIEEPTQLGAFDTWIVALPADAYAAVLGRVLPHARAYHRVIVSGALSLLPLWLHERAGGGTARPLVVSWGTTLATARRSVDADVELGTIRKRFDAAVVPARRRDEGLALCRELFGDRFDPADSILATALSNVNPVAHAAEALPNLTRMERGESWFLFDCLTPSAARLAQAIDDERLRIARGFGIAVRSLALHYHLSYHVPLAPLADMAAAIHARDRAPAGPRTLEHRYVLEDFPYGLAFYERLAAIAGVAVPVTSAAITFACAAYGRDLRRENAILGDLALAELDPPRLLARCAG
jgi:opine dehydrogenase